MNYKTFSPSAGVNAFVKCYWVLETDRDTKPEKQSIIPDGCIEMVFHYGALHKQYRPGRNSLLQPRCFVFGQIVSPLEIESTGVTGIFAVRFHPDGFAPFATIPLGMMVDRAVPLDELFGTDGIELGQHVLQATTTDERIKICEAFLLNRLASSESVDRMVKSSVALLLSLKGQVKISELSEELQISRRQLERRFSTVVGLSPKQLSKIVRLQTTLKMLINNQAASLTALAYDGEYYDQAHFIKDFRQFTGVSPKEFFKDNLKLSALIHGTE
jgi:AraC-like DNA-binding protein